MQRLVTIQWLRGAAAVLVVWFHAMFLVKERYLGAFQTEFAFLSSLGAVGVDLFFMISGFVVTLAALRARTVAGFLSDRMLRIWPPYIVATLAYLAVQPSEVGRPGRVLASLLFIEPFDTTAHRVEIPTHRSTLHKFRVSEARQYATLSLGHAKPIDATQSERPTVRA